MRASVGAAPGLNGCSSQALEQNSCGTWASLLCDMRDLSESGIEPESPALADGFFTPEPPRKPRYWVSLGESSVLLKWRAAAQCFRDASPVLEEPDGAVTLGHGSAAVASACQSCQDGWLACLGPTGLLWAPELEGCPPFMS